MNAGDRGDSGQFFVSLIIREKHWQHFEAHDIASFDCLAEDLAWDSPDLFMALYDSKHLTPEPE